MTIKNNWITTSLVERTSKNLCPFTMTINPYSFEIDSFKNNSKRVAKEICETHKDVYVFYSGGMDSEYVLKVFLDEKLPVTPVLIVTPFNMEELSYAVKFCKNKNIKPFIIEYDSYKMYRIMSYKCFEKGYFSFIAALHLDACDIISDRGGTVVTGYGEPFIGPFGLPEAKNIKRVNFMEGDYYIEYHPGNHVGSFFTYDLSLHFSMLNDITLVGNLQNSKSNLYEVEYRPKISWSKEFLTTVNLFQDKSIDWFIAPEIEKYKNIILGKESVTLT